VGRSVLISLGVVIAAVAASVGVYRALGNTAHVGEMALAAGVCVLALLAGVAPITFAGGATLVTMFQTALIGSVLHMGTCLALAFAAVVGLHRGNVFVYWMLAFYWLTLMELVMIFVARMRAKERSGIAAI
jgi:hypothetical protein